MTSSPPGVLKSERINVRPTKHHFPLLNFLWCENILCFHWPMLCTVSKTKHGHYTEYTVGTLLPPFFISWRTLMWSCEGDCVWHVWRKLYFKIYCVKYFFNRPVNKQIFGGISSAWGKQRKKKKKLQFNRPSSAMPRVGGCAHWITTLLLLYSIKSDLSLEHGSWFDTFLLK